MRYVVVSVVLLLGAASVITGAVPKGATKTVVSIDKREGANDLPSDDGDAIALVIGTFGAVFAGVLTYASLKFGCDCVFGPHKDR